MQNSGKRIFQAEGIEVQLEGQKVVDEKGEEAQITQFSVSKHKECGFHPPSKGKTIGRF